MFDYPITVGFVFWLDANNPEKAQNRWLFSFKTSKKKRLSRQEADLLQK
ncbi:hypothetical protein N750_13080 [Legionella pneumophila str. Leg01/53]|nr:hypothetical protein N750_13080 [Legionella pneumophila str. Leg01/53]ERI48620.1 hypothetical protein N749_01630 [Legionella pneumophila str. Leg01/20]